jgi:D-beta-D-heptose 7-phosphate kinase/D-beta-D-heptose 1-phosphate adenosyltransferase
MDDEDIKEGAISIDIMIEYMQKISNLSCIIISDYIKGSLTDDVILAIMNFAKCSNIPVYVDTKRLNLELFRGCYLIKPNLNELYKLCGQNNDNDLSSYILKSSLSLIDTFDINNILVTAGAVGMFFTDSLTRTLIKNK